MRIRSNSHHNFRIKHEEPFANRLLILSSVHISSAIAIVLVPAASIAVVVVVMSVVALSVVSTAVAISVPTL